MAIAKRIGWILVGVVIGGIGSSSLATVRSQEQPSQRLMTVATAKLAEGVVGAFVKDTQTGACWLSIRSRDDMSGALAPAPSTSCER